MGNGLVKLQPTDARITSGERTTFRDAVSSGFTSEREQMWTQDRRREAEAIEPLDNFLRTITSGDKTVSEDTVNRLFEQDFNPDDALLNSVLTEAEGLGYEIPDDVRPASLTERRNKIMGDAAGRVEAAGEVLSRAGGFDRNVGALVGGLAAGMTDPVNLMTLPAGAPMRAGFLATVLIEGAVNAAIEAAQTPGRNVTRAELGLEDESILENALFGALLGGAFAGTIKGAQLGDPFIREAGAKAMTSIGRFLPDRKALIETAEASGDAEAQFIAQVLRRDMEDQEASTSGADAGEVREHQERAQAAAVSALDGTTPDMPDRPTFAQPRASIIGGEIEEINPSELLVQPDVFQFRSNAVASGGQTERLLKVTEWMPERAGVVIVYEYADGLRAVADGHQRTGLAARISAQTGQEIRMAAKVYREVDGFTPEDIRYLAALKNIGEASDGMSQAMARDAARVLRVRPEAIMQLPAGPGIGRAQSLAKLSDDAFDMFINEVVPERFAELVGRMVENPDMHGAMMTLLKRTAPETSAQAESILAQALEAPVSREVTNDLFGEQEIVESLYLERAKVLERATRLMRDDRSVFRTLDEQAERIQGTGANRLDEASNKQTRQQVEQALAAVQKLAHRAGAISEALNDGAKSYKENGRLKDAAQRVADAVRQEVERNGLSGAGDGPTGRNSEPQGASTNAPDPLEGFSDPLGQGSKDQIANTQIDPIVEPQIDTLADMTPAQSAKLENGLKDAQAFRDVDELMMRSAANHAELTGSIEMAAQNAGVTPRSAPIKELHRVEEKIRDKYSGNINRITDVARGGVEAQTPKAANAFVAALARRYRVLDEGWNLVDGGYFDRKLTVVFDDGQLGEVQIWVPGMFEVKEARGAALYKIYRSKKASQKKKAAALRDMEALYRGVMDKLPPQWRTLFDQETPGTDAPSSATTETNISSDTSGDPSSESTSAGLTGDQVPSVPSSSIDPGSSSTAGIERSTRKNLMGDTSNADISNNGRSVNVEQTDAGSQGLFDGVEPITQRTRLDQEAARPMGKGGTQPDQTEIGGMFDPADPSRFDLFDQVPVARGFDDEGNEVSITKSRGDLAAELDADDEAVAVLDICIKG